MKGGAGDNGGRGGVGGAGGAAGGNGGEEGGRGGVGGAGGAAGLSAVPSRRIASISSYPAHCVWISACSTSTVPGSSILRADPQAVVSGPEKMVMF